jgi:small-conductance mechanosensitive channel
MDAALDPAQLSAWLQHAIDAAIRYATDPWLGLQVVLLLIAYSVAVLVRRALRPLEARWLAPGRVQGRFARLADAVQVLLTPLLFLVLLWVTTGVMRHLTWPSRSYVLSIVASLMTAWIVIRLGSSFIRNPVISKTLALAAWSLAALNITGLLAPTVEVLDAVALTVGTLRISLLTVVKGMATLGILLWAALALSRVLEQRIRRVPDLTPSVQVLIGKLLKITLLTLAIVIALNSVGIDLTAFALFSGAIGVGIGFGLQKVVSNLISGVILLLDKSIKPGDTIEVGATFGWITSLGARYVSVVTRDGKEYLIPNEDLITQRVVNWSFSNKLVRLEIPFGVSYRSDPHAVRRIAREAAAKPSRVLANPKPLCHLVGFGDSSLDFVLRFWIADPQDGVMNIEGEVLLAVWDAFRENDIHIPFPHRHLIIPDPVRVDTAPAAAAGGAG